MISVNLHEAKTKLSYFVSLAEKGQEIILCKRNIPIVKISALKKNINKRPFGLAKGKIKIKDDFFEPLEKDILDGFYKNH